MEQFSIAICRLATRYINFFGAHFIQTRHSYQFMAIIFSFFFEIVGYDPWHALMNNRFNELLELVLYFMHLKIRGFFCVCVCRNPLFNVLQWMSFWFHCTKSHYNMIYFDLTVNTFSSIDHPIMLFWKYLVFVSSASVCSKYVSKYRFSPFLVE